MAWRGGHHQKSPRLATLGQVQDLGSVMSGRIPRVVTVSGLGVFQPRVRRYAEYASRRRLFTLAIPKIANR
jgi:hypothetical protein